MVAATLYRHTSTSWWLWNDRYCSFCANKRQRARSTYHKQQLHPRFNELSADTTRTSVKMLFFGTHRKKTLVALLCAIPVVVLLYNMPALSYKIRNERGLSYPLINTELEYLSFGSSAKPSLKASDRCRSPASSPIHAGYEFLIHQPFTLPDDYSRPIEDILKEDWVCDLQDFLGAVNPERRLVNMIAANSNFTAPLLNWLIGTKILLEDPMEDVIVISLDPPLHNVMIERDIPSLLVSPDSVMFTADFPEVYHMHNGFYQARMMVMRLINHWGYDCANYDTDAIILRNPQVLYDADENMDIDIFAGFAISFPPELHKKWGATLCNGAWLVRSNPRTELFWEHVALTPNAGCERGMDQCKVNFAFDRMRLNWTTTSDSVKEFDLDTEWGATGDVNVIIFPLRVICRQRFCMEEVLQDYYIWHKGSCDKTAEAKKESVELGGLWWLIDDWESVSSHYKGNDWLKTISTTTKKIDF